jgi:hypothetical protein
VSAGRTFNHPYESYANLKPQVTLKATLDASDDWETAVKALQAKAETIIEDHKRVMLQSIVELHDLADRQREVARLEDSITRAQQRLESLRTAKTPLLASAEQTTPDEPEFDEDDPPERERDGYKAYDVRPSY